MSYGKNLPRVGGQSCSRGAHPLLGRLPAADVAELYGHIQVFLSEKTFEGCAGFEISEEVRVTIAAQACLLLLHRDTDYFPTTETIMVSTDEFEVDVAEAEDDWIVTEYTEDRSGESWDYGPIVLSWRDVLESALPEADGYNVVIHEFSHQLDLENGEIDGVPKLPDAGAYAKWKEKFTLAYEAHCEAVARGGAYRTGRIWRRVALRVFLGGGGSVLRGA